MKKYKFKKEVKFILAIPLLLFIAILIILKISTQKTYSVDYSIDSYDIRENYLAKEKVYLIEITYQDQTYTFMEERTPLKEKKVIKAIERIEKEDSICLEIKDSLLKTNPLCSKKKERVDYHLIEKENIEQEEKQIENYTIFTEEDFLIWNYKGFNHIKERELKKIPLFEKDVYDVSLIAKVNEYIIVPDYTQKYSFNTVYIVNTKTNETSTWKLKYAISFDSYVVGSHDKSLYIVDKNKKIEYEIVPHKKKMRIVGNTNKKGITFENGEVKNIALNRMIAESIKISESSYYKYTLQENKLYLSYLDSKEKIRISDKEVDTILNTNKDTIYYISKNTVYKYNLEEGETKILTYDELEFNNKNIVFMNN